MNRNSSTSSSEDLRKFATRVAVFLALLFALDRALGWAAENLYLRTRDGDTGETINALLERPREIIVFGSSRAESHYKPDIIGKALGRGVFNAGFKGSNTIFDYGLEQLVLDRYVPKIIIYDFSAYSVERTRTDPYDRLSPLYPYWRNPHVWQLISAAGTMATWPFLSRIYPYSSKIHSLVIFNIIAHRRNAIDGYDGSEAIMPPQDLGVLKSDSTDYDPRLVGYLRDFIELAHARGARVVVVESPRYAGGSFALPDSVRLLMGRYGIPFLDFNLDRFPEFRDHRLFRDASHLNDAGATRFSQEVGAAVAALESDKGV